MVTGGSQEDVGVFAGLVITILDEAAVQEAVVGHGALDTSADFVTVQLHELGALGELVTSQTQLLEVAGWRGKRGGEFARRGRRRGGVAKLAVLDLDTNTTELRGGGGAREGVGERDGKTLTEEFDHFLLANVGREGHHPRLERVLKVEALVRGTEDLLRGHHALGQWT